MRRFTEIHEKRSTVVDCKITVGDVKTERALEIMWFNYYDPFQSQLHFTGDETKTQKYKPLTWGHGGNEWWNSNQTNEKWRNQSRGGRSKARVMEG